MGLGDFLMDAEHSLDLKIGQGLAALGDTLGTDNLDFYLNSMRQADEARLAKEHPSFFQGFVQGDVEQAGQAVATVAGYADDVIRKVPGGGFILDALEATGRGINSAVITAAHAEAVGRKQGELDRFNWGEFTNGSVWKRAWASWNDPNRTTGGQILASRQFEDGVALDPFAAKDAEAIQQGANETWYGTVLAATVDLGVSMLSPVSGPGTAVLRSSRATNAIGTGVDAERMAQRLKAEGLDEANIRRGGEVKDDLLGYERDDDSFLGRMGKNLREQTDDINDLTTAMNRLGPMMENATDGARVKMAHIIVQANRLEDPDLRTSAKVNAMLALHGSETARKELIDLHPLLAKNIEEMTSAPRQVQLAEMMRNAKLDGETYTVNHVLEKFYDTPSDRAELDALRAHVLRTREDVKAARDLRAEVRSNKPMKGSFDDARLSEARETATANVTRLRAELMQARKDARGGERFQAGAKKTGDVDETASFSEGVGAAKQRVISLETQLAQALNDKKLFDQTPLPSSVQRGDWKDENAASLHMQAEARVNRDFSEAFYRQKSDSLSAKQSEMEAHSRGLNRAHDLLDEIFTLGRGDLATGKAIPSHLDDLKTRIRTKYGVDVVVRTGDGNTPVVVSSLPTRVARWALAPRARGSISLVERDLGYRQLGDALTRSGVYTNTEIRQWQNRLLAAPRATVEDVVAQAQDEMLERISMKHFGSEFDDPEAARKYALSLVRASKAHHRAGQQWVTKSAEEQAGQGLVMVRADDHIAAYDEAMLRSQLADNMPFLDPQAFERMLRDNRHDIGSNMRRGVDVFDGINTAAMTVWKHGVLLRPGLAVRAALDTQLRSMALLSTAETLMNAIVGGSNLMRNTGNRVARRLGQGRDVGESGLKYSLDQRPVHVDLGGGKTATGQLSRDAAERTRHQTAMTHGTGDPWKFFMTETERHLSRLALDRSSWARRSADDAHWETAWHEYAEQLVASPTARWLAANMHKPGFDPDDLRKTPEFQREFSEVASPRGFDEEAFISNLFHEVERMFPDEVLLKKVENHTVTQKDILAAFPRSERFDVPGPETSVLDKTLTDRLNDMLGRMYRLFLDKPDMWLARNPTAAGLYRRALREEAAAVRRAYPDGNAPDNVVEMIDRRARTAAISMVRRTFFDSTRYTGAHQAVAKISPFFAAWEDAMISWARLIHDDPRRLSRLAGAYNATGTIDHITPGDTLVDREGNPVDRNANPDGGKFVAIPIPWTGGTTYRARLSAINSIAQGETWWLPGVGPNTTVPVAQLLAHGDGIGLTDDVAVDLLADHPWLAKQFMFNGELPKAGFKDTVLSVSPGWVRILANDIYGDNFAGAFQQNLNQRIIEAQARGERVNTAKLREMTEQARRSAWTAGTVRLVATAGIGISGTATVDGHFYAERYREISATPKEVLTAQGLGSPQELFAKLYPEAADLDWRLSRNETGIQATVDAQKNTVKLDGVLKDYDESVGWMVLGAGNDPRGKEFSSTAYNMQVTEGGRVKKSADEVEREAAVNLGWQRYRNMQTTLDQAAEQGFDKEVIAEVKRRFTAHLQEQNLTWAEEFNTRENKFAQNLAAASAMAQDKRLRDRTDMQMFSEYASMRQQVMDQIGKKSLSGTGQETEMARAVLRKVGDQYAAQNYGFQQMWDRFLAHEVEERATVKEG